MLSSITIALRTWVIGLFVRAISSLSRSQDRQEAIAWLATSRDIVGSNLDRRSKYIALYRNMNTSKAITFALNSVVESIKNYKNANLPASVKMAIPVTLLAGSFVGGQGAGIVAFGSAIGVPVLLLIFLGTTGITAIVESYIATVDARSYVELILKHIARDEALRQMRADIKNGRQGAPQKPARSDMPEHEFLLRESLIAMEPYEFEKHVMALLEVPELYDVAVTRRSSDGGVDGFARHTRGLIVVQCRRYASTNLVGGPEVQQFCGAVEYHKAWRGYLVTTSGFTRQAQDFLARFHKIIPVNMDDLIVWHREPPSFDG